MATNQKLTKKQKAERIRAAEERELREKERRAAAERSKKIFTVVVCVILVLALGIPTVALQGDGGDAQGQHQDDADDHGENLL